MINDGRELSGDSDLGVWKQALVENATAVILESRSYLVRKTSRSKLREVDFEFEGQILRGLEQNPNTAGRDRLGKGRRSCSS